MNTPIPNPVEHAMEEANRDRSKASDIKNATGAAGKSSGMTLLERQPIVIDPASEGGMNVEIDLSWDHGTHGKGVLGQIKRMFGGGKVDLDLGCLYELHNGKKGCLQSFGNLFGKLDAEPFIALSGDERTGSAPGADESLTISSANWHQIKRVVVYAYIYSGLPDWASLRTEVTLRHGDDAPIFLDLKEEHGNLPICALVMIDNQNDRLSVTRRVEYFAGHPEMDRAYGFGLNWEEGEK